MTNLKAGGAGSWLTRERLLTGLPIVLTGVLCLAAMVIVGGPALTRLASLKTEIVDLEAKKRSLPNLRAQLNKARQEQQTVLDQQRVLLDLIAGQDRIATFLALLEQEATQTGVSIVRYEPQLPSVSSPAPERDRRRQSRTKENKEEAPKDPLTALGYRQTSVILAAQGSYIALQSFLRRMEALELLVEASDLGLKQPPPGSTGEQRPTELTLRLSFFDRASPPDAVDTGAAASEA